MGSLRTLAKSVHARLMETSGLLQHVDECKILLGQQLANSLNGTEIERLQDAEFKVFSQFGDDGIIQYLIRKVDVRSRTFIELGVGDYREANTRFLLVNNGWRGLVCDGDADAVRRIRRSTTHWQYQLDTSDAFLNRDNVNALFEGHGFTGELGLLSIDLDGVDYFVWEAISAVRPTVVVIEYNAVFGSKLAVTVPYDGEFRRFSAHHSGLFWGASLRAMHTLAVRKGYALVGCNSAGNNCYFVASDRLGSLRALTPAEAFVDARFRDSRDRGGRMNWLSGAARVAAIADCPVFDLEAGKIEKLGVLQRNVAGTA
jgi:hypothetical protein